jgi:hypothetical protein
MSEWPLLGCICLSIAIKMHENQTNHMYWPLLIEAAAPLLDGVVSSSTAMSDMELSILSLIEWDVCGNSGQHHVPSEVMA